MSFDHAVAFATALSRSVHIKDTNFTSSVTRSVRRQRPFGRFVSFQEILELLDIFITDGDLTPTAGQI